MVLKVQQQIQRSPLMVKGKTVLVGVSGGADSVCLLDQLVQMGGAKLHVCHLNHQLRGAASDGDERFVRKLAKRYRLPCSVARVDVRALAQKEKLSIEEAAREARLRFFAETAKKLGLLRPVVMLAHHADDQVETFLLRLLRGAGARGLSGMRAKTSMRGLTLLRPLLKVTRLEILDSLRQRKLKFRTDASNQDVALLRNRVRHELLPLLEREYNPGIRAVLRRTAEILGEEDRYLERETIQALKSGKSVKQLPLALGRRAVKGKNPGAGFEEVERRMDEVGPKPAQRMRRSRAVTIRAKVLPCSKRFLSKARSAKRQSGVEIFDADRVGTWTIRTWRPGDRMRPLGMDNEKKLQDLFVDEKIPASERKKIPLVVGASGEIVWAVGVRMSEDFKVTARTRRFLRLSALGR